ncbi:MAG: hypothetical protein HY775_03215 [Acidobacteria bacterium]|nr:hypothetical protein [Acidobacteriota bacterium]
MAGKRSTLGSAPIAGTVLATMACLGAAFLPWLRAGGARRDAFGLASAAATVGALEGWPLRLVRTIVALLPLLVAATWTAGALRRPVGVASLGAAIGILSFVAGLLVSVSIRVEAGPVAGMGAGAAAVAGSAWLIRHERGARDGRGDR